MSFEKTNILDTDKTREAYDFMSRRLDRKLRPLVIQNIVRHFQEQEFAVNNTPEFSDEDKKAHLEKFEQSKQQIFAPNSPAMKEMMEKNIEAYAKSSVNAAEAFSYMTEGNVEDLAVISLIDGGVLSPMDAKDVKTQFGEDIHALLEEVKHARVYRQDTELDTLSANAQALLMMDDIRNFRQVSEAIDQIQPGQKMQVFPREFLTKFKEVEPLFGRNSQLDALYEEAFNALQNKTGTNISLEISGGQANLNTNGKVEGFMLAGPDAPDPNDPNASGPKDPKPPKDGPKPNGPKKGGNGDIKLF